MVSPGCTTSTAAWTLTKELPLSPLGTPPTKRLAACSGKAEANSSNVQVPRLVILNDWLIYYYHFCHERMLSRACWRANHQGSKYSDYTLVVIIYNIGILYLKLSYRKESSPLPVIITNSILLIVYITLIYLFYYIAFAVILIFINIYLNKKLTEIDERASESRVVPRVV